MALHLLYLLLNSPVHPIESAHLNNFWTMVILLGWLYLWVVSALLVCLLAITVIRNLPRISLVVLTKLKHQDPQPNQVFLELVFPSVNTKSAYATEQLHVLLRGLYRYRRFIDRFAGRKTCYSLELVGTNNEGIRYILVVPADEVQRIHRSLLSFMPGMKIRQVNDYMAAIGAKRMGVAELKLASEFAYPLKDHKALEEHDPMAFLTGDMTKLGGNEVMAIQLVVTPVRKSTHYRVTRRVRRIERVIQRGDMIAPELNKQLFGLPRGVWICLLLPIFVTIFAIKVVTAMIVATFDTHRQDVVFFESTRDKRSTGDLYEQELASTVKAKLDQPLFEVALRILVAADNNEVIHNRLDAILATYQMYGSSYQAIIGRNYLPLFRDRQMNRQNERFKNRQLTPNYFSYESIVSSSELSDLYHFPNTNTTQTEGLVKSNSRELPAPLSIRHTNADFDVVIGMNNYGGEKIPIGLAAAERERHMYIIGGTGNGKTTMLQYEIIQDIQNGKGVAVVDPHGDMAETLLRHIPKERVKDVIYFNPVDIAHPIGLNLLEQPEGLSEDELLLEQDFITESVVSIFRKIFSDDDSGGHRIEHFMRNTIHTAFTVPDATLFTVYKLLTNAKFRRTVTSKLTDEDLIDFWKGEFNNAGDYQKVKMSSGVNAKLGRFQRSVVTKRILEQPKSTIDFDEIIQNNKILICNFSKGKIGEDTSALLGISVLTKLQLAALRRSRIDRTDRSPFYLYVDEFQNFATISFVQMLSEARKYRLFLTMAEQSTAQQSDRLLTEAILANVGTVVCFRTGSTLDEELLLPIFQPFLQQGEITNLPAYSYYVRVAAVQPHEPMSGNTVIIASEGSGKIAKEVIKQSRELYSKQQKVGSPNDLIDKQAIKQSSKSKHNEVIVNKSANEELTTLKSLA